MIPTILVYAILIMQQAGGGTGGGTVSTFVGAPPAIPFDVPPIGAELPQDRWTSHYVCTDKSRFLLMSEDGKWHCLKLAN